MSEPTEIDDQMLLARWPLHPPQQESDKEDRGSVLVVRPGQARYQGTDGNGVVRLIDDHGRPTLRFLRDDGGVDGVFRRL